MGHFPVQRSAPHRAEDQEDTYAHREDYKWPVVILVIILIVESGALLLPRKAHTGHELIESVLNSI